MNLAVVGVGLVVVRVRLPVLRLVQAVAVVVVVVSGDERRGAAVVVLRCDLGYNCKSFG